MPKYKCDACGNCTCYSEPKEDWGVPKNDMCLYEVGFPVNWRKVRKKVRAKRPVQQPQPESVTPCLTCEFEDVCNDKPYSATRGCRKYYAVA